MKIPLTKIAGEDPAITHRKIAEQINAISEGRISGFYTARTSAPTTGTWSTGDFIKNANPALVGSASNGYVIDGWKCVAGGTPGTWVESRFTTGVFGQIPFPATQSASSDPNVLDDYEEGNFTPTIFGTTVPGVTTYSYRSGVYNKVGRMVYVAAFGSWTAMTGTGNLRLGGLPFQADSNSQLMMVSLSNVPYTAGAALTGSTYLDMVFMYQNVAGGGYTEIPVDAAGDFWFSGIYTVA